MWKTYRFSWEYTGREIREYELTPVPGLNRNAPDFEALSDLYEEWCGCESDEWQPGCPPPVANTLAGALCEAKLLQRGIPTVYVETRSLAEAVYKARLELTFDSLAMPMPLFAVAVPEGLALDGETIEPFILTDEPILADSFLQAGFLPPEVFAYFQEAARLGHTLTLTERAGPGLFRVCGMVGEDDLRYMTGEEGARSWTWNEMAPPPRTNPRPRPPGRGAPRVLLRLPAPSQRRLPRGHEAARPAGGRECRRRADAPRSPRGVPNCARGPLAALSSSDAPGRAVPPERRRFVPGRLRPRRAGGQGRPQSPD